MFQSTLETLTQSFLLQPITERGGSKMFQSTLEIHTRSCLVNLCQIHWFALVLILAWGIAPAHAQNDFNSGSTGADGPFAPTSNQTVQVPENGIFNFTTVNIPRGVTVTFNRNSKNTPVTMLASKDITIAGTINVTGKNGNSNGSGGEGGPGGFHGGSAGYRFAPFTGVNGEGPGGGEGGRSDGGTKAGYGGGGGFAATGGISSDSAVPTNLNGKGGQPYGSPTLLPLVGGSGGGGGAATTSVNGGAGGGGGGAILIASSGTITFDPDGIISAIGGNAAVMLNVFGNAQIGPVGGGGAGGAIRLVANTITGTGSLFARGGIAFGGPFGANGYIRVEAYDYRGFNPKLPDVPASFVPPNPVSTPNDPRLHIVSVAGMAAPTSPVGELQGVPDIVLPSSQSSPVDIVIKAFNIPLETAVKVVLKPSLGSSTIFQSPALASTEADSSATVSLPLPKGVSVITASATLDLTTTSAQPMVINGERIDRIEVAAAYGGDSQVTYVTRSGKRFSSAN